MPIMDGMLMELPTDGSRDEWRLVWQLRSDMAELLQQVRRENLELRQQVGYWKAQHARAVRRIEELEREVEHLRGENRKLQSQWFGRKTEKQSSQDRSNHLDGEHEESKSGPGRRGQRAGRPGPQRRDYSHLPQVEESVELPVDQQVCPQCGAALVASDTEDSEQVEIEVRAYRRKIRRKRYRRTCTCSGCTRTLTAPPPPKLIPKGLLGVSVWVEILLDKYLSYRPTERLLAHWQLLGLDVAAGTVAAGLEYLEPLFTPLYEALLARNTKSAYMQADETRWLVFASHEGKTGYRWWLWMFLGQDTVAFRLDPSRSRHVPEGHFAADSASASNRGIILMVDRLSSYKAMAQVKSGQVILVFCWAHVRRDFVQVGKGWPELKAWALAWLHRIRALYRLQRQRLTQPTDSAAFVAADRALRQAVAQMRSQADAELADPQLRQPCRKVLRSLQEHWTGLTRFVDDRRIPMDNNASERQVRGPSLGRKNYYGSGALWSGRLATMLFSLFATLRLCNVNPRKWLTWYLQSCAATGGKAPTDVTAFLPWQLTNEQRRLLATDSIPQNTAPSDSS